MTEVLLQIVLQTWEILKEAGVFLLIGYLVAGGLAVLVPKGLFTKLLGTGKVRSVLWASIIGIPLPLCSCGVMPTAIGLRRQGATRGATVAFLVATPETGIDSISLSYALTDPILTIVRPLAGIVTAIIAGLASNLLGAPKVHAQHPVESCDHDRAIDHADALNAQGLPATASIAPNATDSHDHSHDPHGHDHLHAAEQASFRDLRTKAGLGAAGTRICRYAFRELLDETSHWLALGIVLSGIVAAVLPAELIERNLSGGFLSMLWMLLLSIPVYTCASSSTPLAAALVMKGMSPGAALVFLLAGPATNLSSLVMLPKFLGSRLVAVYLAVVGAMILLAGWATDLGYRWSGIDARATFGRAGELIPEPVQIAGAVVLLALLVVSMWRTAVPREWVWLRDRITEATGLYVTGRRLRRVAVAILAALYLSSGIFEVGPGEVGVKERFSRVVAPALGPGLHVRLPWPLESDRVVRVSKVRRLRFGFVRPQPSRAEITRAATGNIASYGGNALPEAVRASGIWFQRQAAAQSYLLTGDANLVDVRAVIQYRIDDPLSYLYRIADPEALVRSTTLTALRGVVATHGVDAVLTTGREKLERQVVHTVQAQLDRYGSGIKVVSFRLLYVHPPEAVHDAFRDVASAQEDMLRTINRAGIFAVEKVNEARANAVTLEEQALAAKDRDILDAQGDAAAFALRLDAYRQAPELTRFRLQLETLGAVLPGVEKIIRPGAGEIKDFDLWLLQPPAAGGGQ
jgi:HflK protein